MANSSAMTSTAIATTGIEKRVVSDEIRSLFPSHAVILAMVEGNYEANGVKKSGEGWLKKRMVENIKFESFIHTPYALTVTVTSFSGTALVVDTTAALTSYCTLINTKNKTECRIDSVTNTTTLVVTTSGSTFAADAGDVLLVAAPIYPENSSSPVGYYKTDSHIWNTLMIVREALSISNSAKGNPTYGGDLWQRRLKTTFLQTMRKIEHSFLFGERPSTETGNTGGSTLSDAWRSTRGFWTWAQNTYDAKGAMDLDKFVGDLPAAALDNVTNDQRAVILTSQTNISDFQKWMRAKQMITEIGELDKVGIRSLKCIVDTGHVVELVHHWAFDQGSLENEGLVMVPDNCFYAYKNGDGEYENRDLRVIKNIQNRDVDGEKTELRGEIGPGVYDGGYSLTKIINWR